MMKKQDILFPLFLLLFAGCNNHTDPSVDTRASGDTPLAVSTVSLSGSIATKAPQNSGSIGVFRTTAGGYTALKNVQYTYSAGWSTASPIYLNSAAASVCAYYPYSAASITSSTDPTAVTLTSRPYTAAEDLCYSTLVSTPTASAPGVAFNMNHAYTRLTLNITHDASYSGTCAITNVSIVNAGIKTSNTLNMTTGAYGAGTAGMVNYNPGIASIASGASATTQVLMVPTTLSGNLDLKFTVDGVVKTASLPVATNNLSTFAAGGNYNINIKVISSIIVQPESNCYMVTPGSTIYIPVSRAVTGYAAAGGTGFTTGTAFTAGLLWSDVSTSHVTASADGQNIKVTASSTEGNSIVYALSGGKIVWSWHIWVTTYVPTATARPGVPTATGGTIVTYNTRYWLDRNLGAKTTGTGATPAAYGLFYQWGRKDPFPSNDATTFGNFPFSKNNTGPVSCVTAVNNPYKFYYNGSGTYDWSSPQKNDYWNSATNTKTVYDPCPQGYRVPLNTYFSGAFTNNTLSGYRNSSDGALFIVGSTGGWWSCVPNGANAFHLSNGGNVNNISRASGFSLRCVQE